MPVPEPAPTAALVVASVKSNSDNNVTPNHVAVAVSMENDLDEIKIQDKKFDKFQLKN